MIKFKLSDRTESLKPYLRELLLYSGISNVVVEIGENQTDPNNVFVKDSNCKTLEDVLSEFALQIYDKEVHNKYQKASVVSLSSKHGESAKKIASVIEKAIEPTYFFVLDRVTL